MSEQWQNRIKGYGEEDPEHLLANPDNWRIHPKYQQAVMKGVLDEVGFVQDVIVNTTTGHMIDGHLRVELAIRKGQPLIPVKYVELTPEEESKVLATFDPIGALAGKDQQMIDRLVGEIQTDDEAVQDLLNDLASQDAIDPTTGGETGDDDAPGLQAKTVTQPGDVWNIGDHRLICGDSTSTDALMEVLEDEMADMIWTDPPYNVDYEGGNGEKIQNDNMEDGAFLRFLTDALTAGYMHTKDGGAFYIAHADSEGLNFRTATQAAGFDLKQNLIWVKSSFTLGRQDYQWQHEPVLYGWKPGAAHHWQGEYNKSTVIDNEPNTKDMDKNELKKLIKELRNAQNTTVIREDKPSRSEMHPTMKPVALVLHMVRNSTKRGERVLDLFGGSGSTLIACEKSARHARLVELDPKYCDVIVRRWQEYTGNQATLQADGQNFNDVVPS